MTGAMLSEDEEERLLQRAVDKGWVSLSDIPEAARSAVHRSTPVRLGPRLDALLDAGLLSEAAISTLRQEAARVLPQSSSLDGNRTLPPPEPDTPSAPAASLPTKKESEPFVSPVPGWAQYELVSRLGEGGMGTVYKARDLRLHRFVAIKFLHTGQESAVQRFQQEARAQARIDHENVCKVHEVGTVQGRPYIAMELVAGLTLNQVMDQLSLEEKLCIVRDAAEALHAAHRLGIIHRDVKPSNLLVQRRDDGTWRPVLMDFGLAHDAAAGQKLTQSGVVMGTPAYMSPEQARGDTRNLDRRTDVYALGATLFELLAGRAPFVSHSQAEVLIKVLTDEPPPLRALQPRLPIDLETLVMKCLQKEPAQRYASARALAEDLQRYLNGEPIAGKRSSLLYRLRRRARKHRATVTVGAVALVGLLGLGTYGLQARLQVRREQDAASARAKLSQELGQAVKELEWFMRSVHELPLHDARYAQRIVQARMQKLKALRHGLGDAGDGLVQYALGHAYLALQDSDRAQEHLTDARRRGNDTPELRGTLGRVLGEQYKRKLEEAARTGDVNFVKAKKRELRAKYIAPAIALLRDSQEAELGSPELLEGLIALYSEQYDEALERARATTRQAPWLYEAKQLAGDVHFARGLDLRNEVRFDEAKESFERAIGSYKEAAEIGRSDVTLYESIAESYLQWGDIATNLQRRFSEGALHEQANAYCKKAFLIAPKRSSCYSKISRAYALLTSINQKIDRSPAEYLENALNIARQGLLLDPGETWIYDSLGVAYQNTGLYEAFQEKDPMTNFKLSIENFKISIDKQPTFPVSLTNLGKTYLHLTEHLFGETPTVPHAEIEAGLGYLRRACAADPSYMPAWVNLLLTNRLKIDYLSLTGHNPSGTLREMQDDLQKALAAGVNIGDFFFILINGYQAYINYLLIKGDITELNTAYERALALATQAERRLPPKDMLLPHVRMFRALMEGQILLAKGQDPTAAVQAGRSVLSACFPDKPYQAECQQWAASLALLAADFARLHGRPELPHLQQAAIGSRKSVELYALTEHQLRLVRILLRLTGASPPRDWPALIAEGLKYVTEGLKDRGYAELHALRARLYLLKLKTKVAAKEQQSLAKQAQDDFAQAVRTNPLLARAYAPYIAQADQLVTTLSSK